MIHFTIEVHIKMNAFLICFIKNDITLCTFITRDLQSAGMAGSSWIRPIFTTSHGVTRGTTSLRTFTCCTWVLDRIGKVLLVWPRCYLKPSCCSSLPLPSTMTCHSAFSCIPTYLSRSTRSALHRYATSSLVSIAWS